MTTPFAKIVKRFQTVKIQNPSDNYRIFDNLRKRRSGLTNIEQIQNEIESYEMERALYCNENRTNRRQLQSSLHKHLVLLGSLKSPLDKIYQQMLDRLDRLLKLELILDTCDDEGMKTRIQSAIKDLNNEGFIESITLYDKPLFDSADNNREYRRRLQTILCQKLEPEIKNHPDQELSPLQEHNSKMYNLLKSLIEHEAELDILLEQEDEPLHSKKISMDIIQNKIKLLNYSGEINNKIQILKSIILAYQPQDSEYEDLIIKIYDQLKLGSEQGNTPIHYQEILNKLTEYENDLYGSINLFVSESAYDQDLYQSLLKQTNQTGELFNRIFTKLSFETSPNTTHSFNNVVPCLLTTQFGERKLQYEITIDGTTKRYIAQDLSLVEDLNDQFIIEYKKLFSIFCCLGYLIAGILLPILTFLGILIINILIAPPDDHSQAECLQQSCRLSYTWLLKAFTHLQEVLTLTYTLIECLCRSISSIYGTICTNVPIEKQETIEMLLDEVLPLSADRTQNARSILKDEQPEDPLIPGAASLCLNCPIAL